MGDLRATLEVTVPQDLNRKAKSALEDLRASVSVAEEEETALIDSQGQIVDGVLGPGTRDSALGHSIPMSSCRKAENLRPPPG